MTPYLLVQVDPRTQVPTEYVQEGRIVLDIADDAVRDLKIESDWITYQASFKGVVRDLKLHIDNIAAIYAAENSAYGMGFEVISIDEATWQAQLLHETTQVTPKKRPFLSIVK
jgi:stringent starvation protein B